MSEFLFVFSGVAAASGILFAAAVGKTVASEFTLRGKILLSLALATFLAAGFAAPPEDGPDWDSLRHDRHATGWRVFGAIFVACLIGSHFGDEKKRKGKKTEQYSRTDDES